MSNRDLRAIWKRRHAEVFRAQLKLVWRKKGEPLTDFAMENRLLMVMVFPGPTDRTTEIVARDVFLEALDDTELTFQIHAQHPRDLDSAVRITHYIEAVMRSLPSRSSKPVRTVVQSGKKNKIEAELKDLRAGKRHLLDTLEQYGKRVDAQFNGQPVPDSRKPGTILGYPVDRRTSGGDGVMRVPRSTAFISCSKEGHHAKNCDPDRLESRELQVSAAEIPPKGLSSASVQKNNSSLLGEDSRKMHLEVQVDGNPVEHLSDTGSEIILILGTLCKSYQRNAQYRRFGLPMGRLYKYWGW